MGTLRASWTPNTSCKGDTVPTSPPKRRRCERTEARPGQGRVEAQRLPLGGFWGKRFVHEVGSRIFPSEYFKCRFEILRSRRALSDIFSAEAGRVMFVPANKQKCREHGVGRAPAPRGALVASAGEFATAKTGEQGGRQQAEGSGESLFPAAMWVRF